MGADVCAAVITPIHDVQGSGATSLLVGNSVTVRGVVTGRRSNGFYLQEPDENSDANDLTSEGILAFTGSEPPAGAAVGNMVEVTGTVAEFVPAADPLQPPVTELTSPSVAVQSTGNPLPLAIALTTGFPSPSGAHDQLERLEGMRVAATSLTTVGATLGNVTEADATATSNGFFYAVVTGNARPFREPGIPAPDPAPSGGGTIPPIPRFDSNPERLRIDSAGLGHAPLELGAGATLADVTGPLDYGGRTYTIALDASWAGAPVGGPAPTAVSSATTGEITIAALNLQRFSDDVDDPNVDEPVLTPTAYANRLAKASTVIRDYLREPDILGVVEAENLATLQDLAAQIGTDALAATQPDPEYDAILVEGNDAGGIDVGFLVKTALVDNVAPRVEVLSVTQEDATELLVNPDATNSLLNDRPPLVLRALVHHPSGESFALVAIVNHLRSLTGANSEAAGTNGWATEGARVRAKRQKQAESLANLVQARQVADSTERIVVVGDLNFHEFNDGLTHGMGVVTGAPAPADQTAVPGDGADLVDPNLANLVETTAAERYSYVSDGNAQSLDHVILNEDLVSSTTASRVEHARIDVDFPESDRNDYTDGNPKRFADHDPLVAYFEVASFKASVFRDGFEVGTVRWSHTVGEASP